MATAHSPFTSIAELAAFVGTWRMQVRFPRDRGHVLTGTCVFEWLHGQQLLVQRTEAPLPMPSTLSIIAPDPARDGYLQHYFDARGVVRLYEMTFTTGAWTLVRKQPDFSPLDFAQRYVGMFMGPDRIRGKWEKATDRVNWELDFELDYQRV
jgi:hypothetical protein